MTSARAVPRDAAGGTVAAVLREPPFTGRRAALSSLAVAARTSPSVVLVEGGWGVGKSRLVTEAVTGQAAGGPPAYVRYCTPPRDPFSYGVVVDLISAAADRIDSLPPEAAPLIPLLPELGDRLSDGEPRGPASLSTAVIAALGAMGRVVLVIEDVHWANADTLRLIRDITADLPPRVTLLLTYRAEEVLSREAFAEPLTSNAPLTRVHLDPMGTDDTAAMLGGVLGRPVPTWVAEEVRLHTSGTPLLIQEAAAAIRARGVPEDRRAVRAMFERLRLSIPIRDEIADLLRRLSRTSRAIAEAAAVIGEAVPADLLARAAGTDARHVDHLVERRLLTRTPEGTVVFRDTLSRRAVYEATPEVRRRFTHRRAYQELSAVNVPPLLLARQAQRARMLPEWLRHGENAADAAMRDGDDDTAIALLRGLVAEPSLTADDVGRLVVKLGLFALTGLHSETVILEFERLLDDPRIAGRHRDEVQAWLGLMLIRADGRAGSGRAKIQMSIDRLGPRRERMRRGMVVLAMPYLGDRPLADSHRWLDLIESHVDGMPPGEARTTLLANTIAARVQVGDPAGWRAIAELPTAPAGNEEQRQLARAHCNLADAFTWAGYPALARRFLAKGMAVATEAGARYIRATAESTQVRLDWLTGRWTGLDTRIDALCREYGTLLAVVSELRLVQGSLACAKGDWGTARRAFQATGVNQPDAAIIPVVIAAHGGLAAMALRRGQPRSALRHANRGLDLLRRKGVWAWCGEILPWAVTAALAEDQVTQARDLIEEAQRETAPLNAPFAHTALTTAWARLAAKTGSEAAPRLYDLAITRTEALGLTYHAALLTEEATTLTPPNPTTLRTLADRYESLGATSDAARCRHHLRALGLTTPSTVGRRGYGRALSPREREIALLVANGHTNQSISETLFLARRTVEDHVSRITTKLNLTSRRDITHDTLDS